MDTVTLDPASGSLQLRTDVAGAAARMGHRLLIDLTSWQAEVEFEGETPTAIRLSVDLASMAVVSGEGGVKPLTSGDRETIVANAAKSLDVARNPRVSFSTERLAPDPGGWDVTGNLTIAGRTNPVTAKVTVTDAGDHWQVASSVPVDQTRYGIKPYAAMLGKLRVADVVRVEFSAAIAK